MFKLVLHRLLLSVPLIILVTLLTFVLNSLAPGDMAMTILGADGTREQYEALRIEFDGRADRIKLIDQAEVRRYRGAVLSDTMTGKVIVYENLTDVFSIDGKSGAGRVKAVLAPRSKTLDKP